MLHGPGCLCGNVESSIKSHLMRIIHQLCDVPVSPPNRILYMNALEKLINQVDPPKSTDHPSSPFSWFWFQRDNSLVKNMIKLFMQGKVDINYKNAFASSIDNFVRNGTPSEKEMVLETGLVEFLVEEIFDPQVTCQEKYQINFDLLSELVHFCPLGLHRLQRILTKRNWSEEFIQLLLSKISDSNVFTRGLLLTAYDLVVSQNPSYSHLLQQPMCQFVLFSSELPFLLVSSVTKDTINQENICCLNSAIIYLMIANCRGELDKQLELISKQDPLKIETKRSFVEVLKFWMRHYKTREKECLLLEHSSQIPIFTWRSFVQSLIQKLEIELLSPDFQS